MARSRRIIGSLLLAVVLLAASRTSGAVTQQPTEPQKVEPPAPVQEQRKPEEPGVINLKGELVSMDVVVVDQENRLYADLEKKNFTIYENGVKQSLNFFSKEEAPISLGLVIDTSRSMVKKLSKVIAAAKSIVGQCRTGDEVFLIDFKAEAELAIDFTKDPKEIEDGLDEMSASGQTALLDAVFLAVNHCHKFGKCRRKAIVLITDGDERDSYYTRDQILQALKETDVQVYSVGFAENLDDYGYNVFKGTGEARKGKYEKRARRLLDDLGAVSGGRAFFPDSLEQLPTISSTISSELRTQFILGYYPTNSALDGSWREVKIEVASDKHREKLIARTRSGYYSGRNGAGPSEPAPRPPAKKSSKSRPN